MYNLTIDTSITEYGPIKHKSSRTWIEALHKRAKHCIKDNDNGKTPQPRRNCTQINISRKISKTIVGTKNLISYEYRDFGIWPYSFKVPDGR